ncbi:MAG: DUF4338 domain-containing protein [Acidovorax sp.]|nr:DUF4338 domain-containing protein [Acidovorax sp.]
MRASCETSFRWFLSLLARHPHAPMRAKGTATFNSRVQQSPGHRPLLEPGQLLAQLPDLQGQRLDHLMALGHRRRHRHGNRCRCRFVAVRITVHAASVHPKSWTCKANLQANPDMAPDRWSRLRGEGLNTYLRYSVYAGGQLVALISFAAAAWRLADRERYVGWTDAQRRSGLHRVVNNTRFLILPWVHSPGLASKVLGMAARRLPADWQQRYGFAPVLLETFVESPRHKGTCYRAANWQQVGRTTGRGKTSTDHAAQLPAKDVWLYPLRKDFRAVLAA